MSVLTERTTDIARPILLMGPGRAGSTVLYNMVTLHRDVGYFISWSDRFPNRTALALGGRLRVPRLEPWAARQKLRWYPQAAEAYGVWNACFPDFWDAVRGPCENPEGEQRLRGLITA